MSATIFPLIFKAGIRRDITRFQSEYVEDGDWVRWYHTYLRKMEGIQSYNLKVPIPIALWNTANNVLAYFYATTINNILWVFTFTTTNQVSLSNIALNSYIATNAPTSLIIANYSHTSLPQIILLPDKLKPERLLLYNGNNLININDTITGNISGANKLITVPQLTFLNYENNTYTTAPFTVAASDGAAITNSSFSGGIFYDGQYLFIYGSNGSVIICGTGTYSLANLNQAGDAVDASSQDGFQLIIGTDKVIYGSSTRGLANSVSILFWTLSSVVLLTGQPPEPLPNVLAGQAQPTKYTWSFTVISKNTSILSSRCVVECDGLFYWPGADGRFYIYNGMVQELPNDLNLDYFFNNLDMTKRQLVYGVLYPRYKEIWWFYAEKINTKDNYNIGNTMLCTHVLIYNITEQSWYDTALTGVHGQYIPSVANVLNMGIPKNYPPQYNFLYQFDSTQSEIILNV